MERRSIAGFQNSCSMLYSRLLVLVLAIGFAHACNGDANDGEEGSGETVVPESDGGTATVDDADNLIDVATVIDATEETDPGVDTTEVDSDAGSSSIAVPGRSIVFPGGRIVEDGMPTATQTGEEPVIERFEWVASENGLTALEFETISEYSITAAFWNIDGITYELPVESVSEQVVGDIIPPGASPGAGWVLIPAGTFLMGPRPETPDAIDRELTQVLTTISRSFWMQTMEVTEESFEELMGYSSQNRDCQGPPPACTSNCPASNVHEIEAYRFANLLSRRAGLPECYSIPETESCDTDERECRDGTTYVGIDSFCQADRDVRINAPGQDPYCCEGFRLPTAAEWEYAARSGTTTDTYAGNIDADALQTLLNQLNPYECPYRPTVDSALDGIAWWWGNSGYEVRSRPDDCYVVHSVREGGQKAANSFGLFDMPGNVWELVHASDRAVTGACNPDTSRRCAVDPINITPSRPNSAFTYLDEIGGNIDRGDTRNIPGYISYGSLESTVGRRGLRLVRTAGTIDTMTCGDPAWGRTSTRIRRRTRIICQIPTVPTLQSFDASPYEPGPGAFTVQSANTAGATLSSTPAFCAPP